MCSGNYTRCLLSTRLLLHSPTITEAIRRPRVIDFSVTGKFMAKLGRKLCYLLLYVILKRQKLWHRSHFRFFHHKNEKNRILRVGTMYLTYRLLYSLQNNVLKKNNHRFAAVQKMILIYVHHYQLRQIMKFKYNVFFIK